MGASVAKVPEIEAEVLKLQKETDEKLKIAAESEEKLAKVCKTFEEKLAFATSSKTEVEAKLSALETSKGKELSAKVAELSGMQVEFAKMVEKNKKLQEGGLH